MTRDELVAAVTSGADSLRASALRLGLDRATAAGWTIAEMLTHVAFWEETCVPMAAHFRGQPRPSVAGWYGGHDLGVGPDDPWPNADVHNAREASWARTHSADAVLARWDTAHARLLALIQALSDDELSDPRLQELFDNESFGHYSEHQAELDALEGTPHVQ